VPPARGASDAAAGDGADEEDSCSGADKKEGSSSADEETGRGSANEEDDTTEGGTCEKRPEGQGAGRKEREISWIYRKQEFPFRRDTDRKNVKHQH